MYRCGQMSTLTGKLLEAEFTNLYLDVHVRFNEHYLNGKLKVEFSNLFLDE